MVDNSLAFARQETRFKIGEYEWREPDYQQIQLWAEALKMEPATVIELLIAGEASREYVRDGFRFQVLPGNRVRRIVVIAR